MTKRSIVARLGIAVVLLTAAACSPAADASASTAVSQSAQAASTEGPCGLLTINEIRRVFPDSSAGTLDRRNEKYNILNCVWNHQGGRLQLISGEEDQSPAEEARSWLDSFVDPTNRTAASRVRFETVAGAGDAAVAVVERADNAKGFMQNAAYIVVRRGAQQILLTSPDLAMRDRAAALAALTELGRAAAGRLR